LLDNSVDSVICNAVLEHVYSPERVVAEMVRVLKPGGMLYAEVPFMFFFHGYPNDFRRYTREGMRRLFGALAPLDIGLSGGPMSALLQTANIVLQGCVPARPALLRKGFNGMFRWLLFPLKYLDLWLTKREDAHLAACGFYVIGRKPLEGEQP
jgi:SAM-dependent methyltransferase